MLEPSANIDHVFHALGDATRRAIVVHLGRGPASVSELAAPLPISLAAHAIAAGLVDERAFEHGVVALRYAVR